MGDFVKHPIFKVFTARGFKLDKQGKVNLESFLNTMSIFHGEEKFNEQLQCNYKAF